MIRRPPRSPLFPSTTLSRSCAARRLRRLHPMGTVVTYGHYGEPQSHERSTLSALAQAIAALRGDEFAGEYEPSARYATPLDRKSTRLNSSHLVISYAVFCLK